MYKGSSKFSDYSLRFIHLATSLRYRLSFAHQAKVIQCNHNIHTSLNWLFKCLEVHQVSWINAKQANHSIVSIQNATAIFFKESPLVVRNCTIVLFLYLPQDHRSQIHFHTLPLGLLCNFFFFLLKHKETVILGSQASPSYCAMWFGREQLASPVMQLDLLASHSQWGRIYH